MGQHSSQLTHNRGDSNHPTLNSSQSTFNQSSNQLTLNSSQPTFNPHHCLLTLNRVYQYTLNQHSSSQPTLNRYSSQPTLNRPTLHSLRPTTCRPQHRSPRQTTCIPRSRLDAFCQAATIRPLFMRTKHRCPTYSPLCNTMIRRRPPSTTLKSQRPWRRRGFQPVLRRRPS